MQTSNSTDSNPCDTNPEESKIVQERLTSLRAKHANLEEAIRIESARPMPDFFVIAELKKKKLTVKEEIDRIGHKQTDAA